MPLYRFSCGQHQFERVARLDTPSWLCPECGRVSGRVPVFGASQVKRWASEFVMPRSVEDAIEEASGYKQEALAAKAEAEANGFRLPSSAQEI